MHVDLTQAPGEVSDFTCCEVDDYVQILKKNISTNPSSYRPYQ